MDVASHAIVIIVLSTQHLMTKFLPYVCKWKHNSIYTSSNDKLFCHIMKKSWNIDYHYCIYTYFILNINYFFIIGSIHTRFPELSLCWCCIYVDLMRCGSISSTWSFDSLLAGCLRLIRGRWSRICIDEAFKLELEEASMKSMLEYD